MAVTSGLNLTVLVINVKKNLSVYNTGDKSNTENSKDHLCDNT